MDRIINLFNEIPEKEKKEENLLSICGFPHYEKVSSNILKFFFDRTREHKLSDLFLKSLFNILNIDEDNSNYDFEIETEKKTEKGNFIDLFIYNEELVIIIENKIFAELYNDLDDYYEFSSKKSEKVYGVVLSIEQMDASNENFNFITYEQFFKEIERNICKYMYNCNKEYLSFLLNYIENTRNLKRSTEMDIEFINFVKENENDVLEINKKLKTMHDDFRQNIKRLNNLVNERIGVNSDVKQWAWRELPQFFDIAVTDIYVGEINICFHSTITLSGWEFEIWESSKLGVNSKIIDMLNNEKIEYSERNSKFLLNKKYELDEDLEIIAKYIIEIIEMVKKNISA